MVLKHKPNLCICRELKREFGFEKQSEYVKGVPSRNCLLSFVHVLMSCLRSWVGILKEEVNHASVLSIELILYKELVYRAYSF